MATAATSLFNYTNNNTNGVSVFRLFKIKVLHKILQLSCLKLKKIMMLDGSHLVFDPWMTLNHKNNNFNEGSVFKLVKNEILHGILGLFCQKLKIQDGCMMAAILNFVPLVQQGAKSIFDWKVTRSATMCHCFGTLLIKRNSLKIQNKRCHCKLGPSCVNCFPF